MELSRNLKKILLVGMSALMLASVGAGTGNLTANAKRRYRPRIARRVRRYRRRATRRYRKHVSTKGINSHNEWSKHPSKAQLAYFATHAFNFRDKDGGLDGDTSGKDYANIHHVSINKAYHNLIKIMNGKALYQKQSNKFDRIDNDKVNVAASKYAVDYINKIRSEYGVNTLDTNPDLTKIAYQRAEQDNVGHRDSNGNLYMDDLANKDGISLSSTYGENSDDNTGTRYDAMLTTHSRKPNSNKVSKDMGKDVYIFMHMDKGHRENVLSSDWNRVGVGITNNGNIVEDFEG